MPTKKPAQKPASKPASKSASKAPSFKTIPANTAVSWHYRSAIGHGTVTGVHKLGSTADNTMYSINEHDHHPGEPDVVFHSGKALTRTAK
ncbi:MAG: hypothetical protein ABI035_10360 [Gemmatimonadaceae bacterium]